MQYILGIDIGTTHCKAVALSREAGPPLFEAHASYATVQSSPGQSEQDPNEIFRAVLQVMQKSADHLKEYELSAVCFSAAMHSLLLVDEHGGLLTPAYTWADTRSNEYALYVRNHPDGQSLYERTGTPIHPMSPLCKIMWLSDIMPDIVDGAAKFISIKEYIYFKLTGEYVVDHSIASATGMFDIHLKKWDEQALSFADITADHLSQPVPVTYSVKRSVRVAGIQHEIPLIIGGSDGCLANIGSGAIFPGNAALTIGTSGAVRIAVHKPRADAEQRLFNYILTENMFITGGAVSNGAAAMKWFAENFMQHPFTSVDDIRWFMDIAMNAPPGAGGLLFLPYLSGERAPFWDASARGAFIGMQMSHGPSQMARAVVEGISYALLQVMQVVEKNNGTIDTIYASGGFTNSEKWLQLIADMMGKNVLVIGTADASATGAALLGMRTLGWFNDWQTLKELISIQKKYPPDMTSHEVYQQHFNIYKQLYPKLKDHFRELEQLHQQ